ncbi:aldehyde dehydrogenase family protein [Streptomyces sp. NPDC102441]|uniref:aldehyde dehydrogenase family protein n=1 Tax=Streptomyces sp. NPDC102441 TaxID=3366176 RepID=UPI003800EA81
MPSNWQHSELFIDGAWRRTARERTETVINPATEEPVGSAPVGEEPDVSLALAAARRAFDEGPWPRLSGADRSLLLGRFHDALVARAEEIVAVSVAESGPTRPVARFMHVNTALPVARYYADLAASAPRSESLPHSVLPAPGGASLLAGQVKAYDAVGVVSAITPFNVPFFMNVVKVFPALAAGNTVVLKPSPFTPLSAFLLAEAAAEAELPPGVLNLVTGGNEVGTALTTDPRVDLVTFTGSDAVGAKIMAQAASTLKRVTLELGGKSALIVREDADLAAAIGSAVGGISTFSGQACALATRHLVHNSVREQYVAGFTEALKRLTLGDPAEDGVTMGPLIHAAQRERVERYVRAGLDGGAELVAGGGRPAHLERGFFFEPTVFDNVDNRSVIAQEEIFGPVICVIGFDSDDEAVSLANDSAYGLGGGILSRDTGRAFEMARRVRTGQISINGGVGGLTPVAPFGGYGRSGIGRELGIEGLREYQETKVISFKAG